MDLLRRLTVLLGLILAALLPVAAQPILCTATRSLLASTEANLAPALTYYAAYVLYAAASWPLSVAAASLPAGRHLVKPLWKGLTVYLAAVLPALPFLLLGLERHEPCLIATVHAGITLASLLSASLLYKWTLNSIERLYIEAYEFYSTRLPESLLILGATWLLWIVLTLVLTHVAPNPRLQLCAIAEVNLERITSPASIAARALAFYLPAHAIIKELSLANSMYVER